MSSAAGKPLEPLLVGRVGHGTLELCHVDLPAGLVRARGRGEGEECRRGRGGDQRDGRQRDDQGLLHCGSSLEWTPPTLGRKRPRVIDENPGPAPFRVFIEPRSCDDRRVARLALALLGLALGVYAIGLAIWEPGTLTLPAPVHVAIGWSFLAAGIVASRQRPENRLGLLMMLSGVLWFGRDFDWFGSWTADHA